MSAEPFIYLLNRMEVAAHSANPSEADFAKHRKAVIDRVTALESTRDELVRALEQSVIALDDWLHVHADDMCDPVKIMQARERINEYGTLAYIARAQEQNRAALANAAKVE